jgi:hypothetical protein
VDGGGKSVNSFIHSTVVGEVRGCGPGWMEARTCTMMGCMVVFRTTCLQIIEEALPGGSVYKWRWVLPARGLGLSAPSKLILP